MAAWMAAWKDRCLGGGVDAGWAMGLRLRLLNPCRQRRLKQQQKETAPPSPSQEPDPGLGLQRGDRLGE